MNQVKKTSGRYKIAFCNDQTKLFISCNINTGEFLPPTFSNKGMELTILDQYILQTFKNEEQLRSYLKALGYIIPDDYKPKIIYQSQGQTKMLEIIYQNSMLMRMATVCQKYKERYSNKFEGNKSSQEIRKLISKGIIEDPEWIEFYQKMKSYIQLEEFYDYLMNNPLLGKKVLWQIQNFLDKMSFSEYYLKSTFASYKPIRGMIFMIQKYHDTLGRVAQEGPEDELQFLYSCFSEAEMLYIEKHPNYERMTLEEKKHLLQAFCKRKADSSQTNYQKIKEN